MIRSQHVLKSFTSREVRRYIACVDTEARIEKSGEEEYQTLRVGYIEYYRLRENGVYHLIDSDVFNTVEGFWDSLIKHLHLKMVLTVYCHNYNYDAVILKFNTFLPQYFKVIRAVSEPDIFFIKARRGTSTVLFIDSGNYFKTSLEGLGKSLGFEKLKVDYETVSDDDLMVYLKQDVRILAEAVCRLNEFAIKEELGSTCVSAASFAFWVFRKRFMRHKIFIHDDESVLLLEREGYYGGRTEAWVIGRIETPVYVLDVNSMYPYVMQQYAYPVRLLGEYHSLSVGVLKKLMGDKSVVARVTVNTEYPIYPCRVGDNLIFPVGEFETVLTTPEIEYALAHGHVETVGQVAVYERQPLFVDYVNYFYNKRLEYKEQHNDAYQMLCKLLLNSLYGKFGQRLPSYIPCDYEGIIPEGCMEWEEIDAETYEVHEYRTVLGKVYERIKCGESYESFPAIAAHVTAYARMYLWYLVFFAGLRNVYYMDTDSLFVSEEGYNRLKDKIDDKKLGAIKLEYVSKGAEIYGAKDYRLDNRVKLKGVKLNHKDTIQVSETTYVQVQFPSFLSSIRAGKDGTVVVTRITKHLSRLYRKGKVLDNGLVSPFRLPEDAPIIPSY